MKSLLATLLLILFHSTTLLAQASPYPQSYFRSPVKVPISLAGNFGECRPGHFHMGLDIKTDGKENMPILAAADGYVTRVKMEPGGFGHVIYIAHPNGYTTLYAHLNKLMPALQKWVEAKQYAIKSWEQDLSLSPEQFPIKKGQQIAWSGNTGGSSAPHLHFEIRDSKTEKVLNPQLFGFEIADSRPPVPTQVAVYTNPTAAFYDKDPQLYTLRKENGVFTTSTITSPSGDIGFGLVVNDYMDGSANTLAFYKVEISTLGTLVQSITLDNIGYDETRYLHAYADYRMKEKGKGWIQLLFRLPGNLLTSIYGKTEDGTIKLKPNGKLPIQIVITDVAGNKSIINLDLQAANESNLENNCGNINPSVPINLQYREASVDAPSGAVYANICASYKSYAKAGGISDVHLINNETIPLHKYATFGIRPTALLPFEKRDKVVMLCKEGNSTSGKAANPDNSSYTAAFRNFGEFSLVLDTVAPVIKPIGNNSTWMQNKKISFQVKEDATSVKSFSGTLDGQWLCFEQHRSNWFYNFDQYMKPGKHTLVVRAEDENGNVSTASYIFTR